MDDANKNIHVVILKEKKAPQTIEQTFDHLKEELTQELRSISEAHRRELLHDDEHTENQ